MSRNTPTNSNASWYQTLKSQEQPVLIYQMGKVGSSALEHSIPNSVHLHDLMTVDAKKQISPVRAQLHKPQINALKRRLKRIAMSRMLKRKKKFELSRWCVNRSDEMFQCSFKHFRFGWRTNI